jgi:hypothetical protein
MVALGKHDRSVGEHDRARCNMTEVEEHDRGKPCHYYTTTEAGGRGNRVGELSVMEKRIGQEQVLSLQYYEKDGWPQTVTGQLLCFLIHGKCDPARPDTCFVYSSDRACPCHVTPAPVMLPRLSLYFWKAISRRPRHWEA